MRRVVVLGLWQCAAALNVGSAVFSKLLARKGVATPVLQMTLVFGTLAIVFSGKLFSQRRNKRPSQVNRLWFLLCGLIELQANASAVKAYQFTSIVSVQLLDCVSIPVVLVISVFCFKTRFNRLHYFGIAISVIGMLALILTDTFYNRANVEAALKGHAWKGDLLAVTSGILFALSNSILEYLVKRYQGTDIVDEYLSGLGLVGACLGLIQAAVIGEFDIAQKAIEQDLLFFLGVMLAFVFTITAFYTLGAHIIRFSSAAVMNLSLLASDFWSLLFAFLLFGDGFHVLYLISFVCIVAGVVVFYQSPSQSSHDASVYSPIESSRGSLSANIPSPSSSQPN